MKLFVGIFLAALAVFVFGAAWWLSPLGAMAVETPPDDARAQAALASAFPESGTYFVPGNMADPGFAEAHRQGPLAMVSIRMAGDEVMSPGIFVNAFLHELLVMALLAALMRQCLRALPSYGSRVRMAALVGLVGAVFIDLSALVWFYAPPAFSLLGMVYDMLAITIGGAVLAAFIKPLPA